MTIKDSDPAKSCAVQMLQTFGLPATDERYIGMLEFAFNSGRTSVFEGMMYVQRKLKEADFDA
jgi:hypothetical protein